MPAQQTVVTAFVASPGDVAEERALLEEIVSELNLTWSRSLKLRVDLVRWETHIIPGIGSYPQEVINRQIGDDYDVFIGILGSRFGTETPEHGSATAEEFERALARYREKPGSLDIMFYFKDSSISPSQIDLTQFSKVIEFKRGLGDEGVLHWRFGSRAEFIQLLRVHLSRVAQRWQQKTSVELSEKPSHAKLTAPLTVTEENEELGFLDHLEEGNAAFERGAECLGKLTSATEDVGAAMVTRAAEANEIITPTSEYDVQAAKKVANATAQDLNDFAVRMEVELPLFSDAYERALTHIVAAANLAVQDFKPDLKELTSLRDAVAAHESSVTEAIRNVVKFKQSMLRLPRLQSVLIKRRGEQLELLKIRWKSLILQGV